MIEKLQPAVAQALFDRIAEAAAQPIPAQSETPPLPSPSPDTSVDTKVDSAEIRRLFNTVKPFLKLMPQAGTQLFAAVRNAVQHGDIDSKEAEMVYDALLDVKPDADIYFYRGLARRQQNKLEQAMSDYSAAIALDPNMFEAYANRAVLHVLHHDFAEAVADATEALRLHPDDAIAFNNRAFASYKLGNYAAGLSDVQKAIAIDSTKASFYHTRGQLYAALGDRAAAAADYQESLRLNPNQADAEEMRQTLADLAQ